MKLGEFSVQLKEMSVRPGSVFKMTLFPKDSICPKNEGDKSRTKYFVVLGKDEDSILVGSLLINTDVNVNLIKVIAPYQHCIYPKDYQFLGDKYRYIDCYKIKEFQFNDIVADGEFIGTINQQDMDKAIQLANDSPVNKPHILKKYNVMLDKK